MAEDKSFKEVTQEIKETNKLIRQQITDENKGSKLGASFKNAAGEIITELAVGLPPAPSPSKKNDVS